MEDVVTGVAGTASYPLHVLQRNKKTVGIVGADALAALPMAGSSCTHHLVTSATELKPFLTDSPAAEVLFKWCARVSCSLSRTLKRHCLVVKNVSRGVAISALLEGVRSDDSTVETVWADVERSAELWKTPFTGDSTETLHVYMMSVPEVPDTISNTLHDMPGVSAAVPECSLVTTRVLLGDSASEIVASIRQLFHQFLGTEAESLTGTEVCWPASMLFPVNVHTRDDARRRAEHAALRLPYQGLLHHEDAIQAWSTWDDLRRQHEAKDASVFRTGAAWERHLATSPHRDLAPASAPSIPGAETLLVSGAYDYYHYRVDGFRDDGWGCAYRSLQTVLSWFQHAGLLRAAIPSIRRIQEILYQVDPDKASKRAFVGSRDWIGSFEIMLVLQQYFPGLECTIKRLERGQDLDTDSSVQLLLIEHFRSPLAAPVMIGGSSYAHTILGVHMNVHTMEAQYLILDPHYSAYPTQIKTAVRKGYVGWKEASKFFEAGCWYNLCIPRVDLFDPR
ncbi:UFMP / Peptidase family C78 / ubiquitin modifier-specific peptidase 1 [Leishmania donovani]|uniref:Peptidase C78 family protein n=1 Tax=Leishmania donovani TaxID=5661 RepID=A0A504XKS2_LEIDO|nr:Peptidase C78 family protein [Leishmania donovani]CAJ1992766.1 UFMP / Peptidase family C78 / ubiquitin modifier-specific peptidase 1 [Leishmania donovani]VDZ48596.1 Peptidase_family_C78_putative/Pfam:PF07910 [Leishmania donovani]